MYLILIMNKLHPGAKWKFRVRSFLLFGLLGIIIALWIISPLIGLLLSFISLTWDSILRIILFSLLGYLILVIIASEIYSRMFYNNWFYEFTASELKLERGIIWKKYSHIPYARIQNIELHRGVIARMLGFSTILVQTAGSSGNVRAEGNIPAVELNEADKIRKFLMKKITSTKRKKDL